jgi:hypothetical protein
LQNCAAQGRALRDLQREKAQATAGLRLSISRAESKKIQAFTDTLDSI